jgi:hypothetical protein
MFHWKRGALRLWMVATVLWWSGVVFNSLETKKVRWPFSPSRTVHVGFGTHLGLPCRLGGGTHHCEHSKTAQ